MKFLPANYTRVNLSKAKYSTKNRNMTLEFDAFFDPHPADEENMDAGYVKSSFILTPHTRIHADLERALKMLRLHFMFISEILDEEAYDLEIFKQFRNSKVKDEWLQKLIGKCFCTQVGFRGEDDKPEQKSIYLVGQRQLRTMHILNLTTPTVKLEQQEGQKPYKFLHALNHDINEFQQEVEFYLQGKWECDEGQLDLFASQPVLQSANG